MGEWSFPLLAAQDDCRRCEEERLLPFKDSDPIAYIQRHMMICATCGSKRCAKADDHRNLCDGYLR